MFILRFNYAQQQFREYPNSCFCLASRTYTDSIHKASRDCSVREQGLCKETKYQKSQSHCVSLGKSLYLSYIDHCY